MRPIELSWRPQLPHLGESTQPETIFFGYGLRTRSLAPCKFYHELSILIKKKVASCRLYVNCTVSVASEVSGPRGVGLG